MDASPRATQASRHFWNLGLVAFLHLHAMVPSILLSAQRLTDFVWAIERTFSLSRQKGRTTKKAFVDASRFDHREDFSSPYSHGNIPDLSLRNVFGPVRPPSRPALPKIYGTKQRKLLRYQ